jgi:hypothetical protein
MFGSATTRLLCTALALLAVTVSTACSTQEPQPKIDEPEHIWPREAQSDFLDIGEQAGIKWLSFVPNDSKEYPELYAGLSAQKPSKDRALFMLGGSTHARVWQVEWFGTNVVALELRSSPPPKATNGIQWLRNVSLALCQPMTGAAQSMAMQRAKSENAVMVPYGTTDSNRTFLVRKNGELLAVYHETSLEGHVSRFMAITEWLGPISGESISSGTTETISERIVLYLLSSDHIRMKRELGLEGFPGHKCTSTVDELFQGRLVFSSGSITLKSAARKTGGDSTIQIDGHGANPWITLHRLEVPDTDGDIRVALGKDPSIARRREITDGRFSVGFVVKNPDATIVAFEFESTNRPYQMVGLIHAGGEFLVFETSNNGLTGAQAKEAKLATLNLLRKVSATEPADADLLKPLIGLNIGTLGRDE